MTVNPIFRKAVYVSKIMSRFKKITKFNLKEGPMGAVVSHRAIYANFKGLNSRKANVANCIKNCKPVV